ncbi:hypothetical protein AXG93_59s1260 [Marchantia polymorpha subsp. ruderalis]|uniref:Uncharacterized protein n=1 Tax=Marchantia polymorpha subsp. ruderalis TaxID=1480154 RepID=A0A176W3U3_MARPO|nr:hypothetical protein AXG93_59s1260 [Marchantia polymorpha subsp. ruderalis]
MYYGTPLSVENDLVTSLRLWQRLLRPSAFVASSVFFVRVCLWLKAVPSPLGCSSGGRMRLRWKKKRKRKRRKLVPSPRAHSSLVPSAVCTAMVRKWLREKNQPPRGYRPHPERWRVSDWEQVLRRCAGEEGDLLFECKSVHISKEEEISFGALFKNCKSSKKRYRTCDYVDRKRRNVAVALLQILQPHRTTYMTSWHEGFVEMALAGTPIHWARILWKATRQHAQEEKGGSINHLSPFLINFYRSMECMTAEERLQFPLLSRANPRRYVRDVEVDTDPDKMPASTPPA